MQYSMKPCILVLLFLCHFSLPANDWPSWRGPNGDGKLAEAEGYPVDWSPDNNLLWKVPLPSPGNSSPIVIGDKLFLTLASDQGQNRSLHCYSTKDGSLLWEKSTRYGKKDQTHKTNPYSSASPFSDGVRVYAWQGNAGLYTYDLDGNEIWKRNLGTDYAHIWGPNAASPVVHGDTLIIHAGPGLAVALFGLDKNTGETLWKKELPTAVSNDVGQLKGSWATPLLIENAGRTEMLIGLPRFLTSFDPKDGSELWKCGGLTDLAYTNALAGPKRAVYLAGYGGPGIGVKLPEAGVSGNITETHRLWADEGKKPNRQRIGSGQMIGEHIFQLDEPGIMVCLEVDTGKKLWQERMSVKSWSSMNLIGELLYVSDTIGTTFIIEPDTTELKLLHTNQVDKRQHTNSSLAFAKGVVYQRTDDFLYAFKKSEQR